MQNYDPRYVRSRLAFRSTLVELAQEDVSRISVSLVCERTGIDRATFYRHFTDLDELIADTLMDLADRGAQDWRSTSRHTGDQDDAAAVILTGYLTHLADNWSLYRWALGRTGFARAIHSVLDNFTHSITDELAGLDDSLSQAELARYAAYTAGGMLGFCLHWLDNDEPEGDPADLARWILQASPRPAVTSGR